MNPMEKVPLNSLVRAVCAWRGCNKEIIASFPLPQGWKCLVVGSGSLDEPQNLLTADVDGVLCPEHFKELLSLLKIGEVKDEN